MTSIAYKLVDGREWQTARQDKVYRGSVLDRADCFIHLSTAAQLPGTATRHYAGIDDLRMVTVDLAVLGEAVRWEPSRGGDLFPHIYGDLPMMAVRSVRGLSIDADGRPRFADGTVDWSIATESR